MKFFLFTLQCGIDTVVVQYYNPSGFLLEMADSERA